MDKVRGHGEQIEVASPAADSSPQPRKLSSGTERRWWRNYPLLISAAAFALSLITSLISAYTSYRRDIHDQQTQLSFLTQSLQDLLFKQA